MAAAHNRPHVTGTRRLGESLGRVKIISGRSIFQGKSTFGHLERGTDSRCGTALESTAVTGEAGRVGHTSKWEICYTSVFHISVPGRARRGDDGHGRLVG